MTRKHVTFLYYMKMEELEGINYEEGKNFDEKHVERSQQVLLKHVNRPIQG